MEYLEPEDPASEVALNWERFRPLLDEAMSTLGEDDRDALLHRFFKNQDFRTVGVALGISDDAAQKRVSRAVEKLRGLLARRGITTTASALSAAISVNAVQPAPAGLAAAISTAATLAGTTLATTAAATATKAIAMTTLQKTLITIIVAAGVAAPLMIQRNAQVKLRAENRSLRRQVEQLAQLTTENERLSNLVAQSNQPAPSPGEPSRELLRLRGQVGLLRQQSQGLAKLLSDRQQTASAADFEPSSSWADSGNATPQAAATTFAWAVKTGNRDKLAEVLVFETSQSDTNRAPAVYDLTKDFQPFMSEIDASRLILTDDDTADQVTFWYQSRFKDGHTLVSPLTLQRVGSSWKVRLVLGGDEAEK